jgi:hypothetical protein
VHTHTHCQEGGEGRERGRRRSGGGREGGGGKGEGGPGGGHIFLSKHYPNVSSG